MNSQQYLVLARKYRPQNFSDLVGQQALVQTLRNSIKQNKIHHAFLLTGIRGIGKTTTARIIAKALNCLNFDDKNIDPCGQCDNCQAIAKSNFQDVVEIDAASRTGVDDVRNIIENLQYAPTLGKYKIYIIDEVHMLSNNAFNAFLKTLEEPPKYVKFIFATTEIHKIPATITSRCQKFNLKRLNNQQMVQHLQNILKQEGAEIKEDILNIISYKSEGSVRDALSLLDSVIAYSNEINADIKISDLSNLLGILDGNKIIDLFHSLYSGKVNNSLQILNDLHQQNFSIAQIHQNLLQLTHLFIITKSAIEISEESIFFNYKSRIEDVSKETSMVNLLKIWQILTKFFAELKNSIDQKSVFEIALIRICHLVEFISEVKLAKESMEQPKEHKSDMLLQEAIRNFPNSKIIS